MPLSTSGGADATAAKTARMMRASIEKLVELRFKIDGRDTGKAEDVDAFIELSRTANHARSQQARSQKSWEAQNPGGGGGSPGSAEMDYLSGVLRDCDWDPGRLLGFLRSFQRARPIYQHQVKSLAIVLAQISTKVCEHVRSDQMLVRWLGTLRGQGESEAVVVSYALASGLRWATLHAAAHWESKLRGKGDELKHLAEWERQRQQLLELKYKEFERGVVELLLEATFVASKHCMTWRFPDSESCGVFNGTRGLLQNGWGLLGGREDFGPDKERFLRCFDEIQKQKVIKEDPLGNLKWMIWSLAWCRADAARGYCNKAQRALVTGDRHLQRAIWGDRQWRGVILRGWFLLEPGQCASFWRSLPPGVQRPSGEWGCCAALGGEAARTLTEHWQTYYTMEDFAKIKEARLTHVRLPFGAWCVDGPRPGEPYAGPCLDLLDRALDMLEDMGLLVLLDLHGWRNCDRTALLPVLEKVAKRYAGRACVCGMSVCNEPDERLPAKELADYYKTAVKVIRQAGMRAGEVAVFLPIFTKKRKDELLGLWEQSYMDYEDCVFDLRLHQRFGPWWGMPLKDVHLLKRAKARAGLLRTLPACCVSDLSLKLPRRVVGQLDRDQLLERFAGAQVEAYEWATHGWFFWSWKDSAGATWSMSEALERGVMQVPRGPGSGDVVSP